MQSVLDSLCRCFGTPVNATDLDGYGRRPQQQYYDQQTTPPPSSPPSADVKKRTRSLKLQEEQWDALFDCNAPKSTDKPKAGKEDSTLEQAQAVAQAKLEAHGGSPKATKRKRGTADDIFRSKKPAVPNATHHKDAKESNPFSRFLTNNPVFANSLCFATPVRDSDEEPDTLVFSNSVVSDTNTLNTAEDTITSTLYYEQVKLAGLKQKNPPMPLFNNYEVKASDPILKVVASDTYSSALMKDWVRANPDILKVEDHKPSPSCSPVPRRKYVEDVVMEDAGRAATKSKRKSRQGRKADDDDIPGMVNSSSESTSRST